MMLAIENWEKEGSLELAMLLDISPCVEFDTGFSSGSEPWRPGGPLALAAASARACGRATLRVIFSSDARLTWGSRTVTAFAGGLLVAGEPPRPLRYEVVARDVFCNITGADTHLPYKVLSCASIEPDPDRVTADMLKDACDPVLGFVEPQASDYATSEQNIGVAEQMSSGCTLAWRDHTGYSELWFVGDAAGCETHEFLLSEYSRRPYVASVMAVLGFVGQSAPSPETGIAMAHAILAGMLPHVAALKQVLGVPTIPTAPAKAPKETAADQARHSKPAKIYKVVNTFGRVDIPGNGKFAGSMEHTTCAEYAKPVTIIGELVRLAETSIKHATPAARYIAADKTAAKSSACDEQAEACKRATDFDAMNVENTKTCNPKGSAERSAAALPEQIVTDISKPVDPGDSVKQPSTIEFAEPGKITASPNVESNFRLSCEPVIRAIDNTAVEPSHASPDRTIAGALVKPIADAVGNPLHEIAIAELTAKPIAQLIGETVENSIIKATEYPANRPGERPIPKTVELQVAKSIVKLCAKSIAEPTEPNMGSVEKAVVNAVVDSIVSSVVEPAQEHFASSIVNPSTGVTEEPLAQPSAQVSARLCTQQAVNGNSKKATRAAGQRSGSRVKNEPRRLSVKASKQSLSPTSSEACVPSSRFASLEDLPRLAPVSELATAPASAHASAPMLHVVGVTAVPKRAPVLPPAPRSVPTNAAAPAMKRPGKRAKPLPPVAVRQAQRRKGIIRDVMSIDSD
jgi:hypothetical protein